MKKIYSLIVSLAIISLISCSDNIGEGNVHNDGYLHFNFMFNSSNETAWHEADGAKKAARFEAPILVEADMGDFQPLYLHTLVLRLARREVFRRSSYRDEYNYA